jgi:hypothetical protein
MEMVDRYLQAVKFWLPKGQQADIIAELSEDLSAQIEERETALGRKLNDPEVETLLRQRGSPIKVANGYLPQQSLIGPLLFPIYVFVLKIVTLLSLIPAVVGFIASIVSRALGNVVGTSWTPPFGAIASHFWNGWFASLTVVTIVFAVLERTPAKNQLFEVWNPRKLPPLRPANAIPRTNSAIEIAVYLCVLVWWAATMAAPLTIRLGNLHVALTPAWSFFYGVILLTTLAGAALSIVNFIRPWWTTQRAVARVIVDAVGGVFFCWMFKAHLVASLSWPTATPDKAAYVVGQLNIWLARIFPWAIAVTLFFAGIGVWRMVRIIRKSSAHPMRTALV